MLQIIICNRKLIDILLEKLNVLPHFLDLVFVEFHLLKVVLFVVLKLSFEFSDPRLVESGASPGVARAAF